MFETIEHDTVLISTLLCTRNPYTIPILKYSSVFIVLGVRMTKCQQIHSDIAPAAQQMFTYLFTYLLGPLYYF